jgi:serine/threonine-protein kinase
MTIPVGTRLGAFEVTGSLGSGGMGEVYRAHDTKLNRDVALKVLPDNLLDNDRLARFRREAQAVAALNHPNIAAIYGFEDSLERPALVLELVEGPTLADRIAQGPNPLDEAVAIARQIADALEAAHEQGIVHRDLKPANVKLRPDGVVKVLDFGLAKLTETGVVRTAADPTMSPTLTSPAMTGVGVILGTAAYMSPEQAAGRLADKRADIWSFGVVLWEMLNGERLFASGESTSHVLADVLRAPIDFGKIPAGPLRELLRRCLDRDVKTRLRDIGEARVVLSRPLTTAVVPAAPSRRAMFAWATAAAALAVSTGIALWWAPWRVEPDRPLTKLEVELGSDVALPATATTRSVVVSPDGTRLLYVASVAGGPGRIYIRRLNEDKAIELRGTEEAAAAAFSPDSQSIAFAVGRLVYRVSADGGAALRLSEVDALVNNLTWGEGDIILASGAGSGLLRIPPNGGVPFPLTHLANTESIHAQAQVLPRGQGVLFAAGGGSSDVSTIDVIPLAGGDRRVIVANGTAPYYLPTGHLLYLRNGTIFAVRFDLDTLTPLGDAVPMVTDVKMTSAGWFLLGRFRSPGTALWFTGGQAAPSERRARRINGHRHWNGSMR